MSKPTRISLAILVSLVVIIGIFSTVQGATLSARQDRAGRGKDLPGPGRSVRS